MIIKHICFALVLIFTFTQHSYSQKDDLSWVNWENKVGKFRWLNWHLGKENANKLTSKWDLVGIDIEKSSNEFAGTYFQYGLMSGYFLRWSPENGFVYVNYFDIEHPCYFNYGKVSVDGFEATFKSEFETDNLCPSTLPKEMPKTWIPAIEGNYFIPSNQVERFGNFYAGFSEFNRFYWDWHDAHPFARKWKSKIEHKEKFILPTPYEKFVKKPINAEITFVGKTKIEKRNEGENVLFPMTPFSNYYSETPVKINVGKNLGLTKGLEFIIVSGESDSETLKVTKVRKTNSEAVVLRTVNDEKMEGYWYYDDENKSLTKEFLKLEVGQKITTSTFISETLSKQK